MKAININYTCSDNSVEDCEELAIEADSSDADEAVFPDERTRQDCEAADLLHKGSDAFEEGLYTEVVCHEPNSTSTSPPSLCLGLHASQFEATSVCSMRTGSHE